MKIIYQQDQFKLDNNRITTSIHPVFGEVTTFHDVVIASEIVQPYDDGNAWKPRDELEAYTWTVDGRWVIVGAHPEEGIISDKAQVAGRTVNPRYVKDLIEPKSKRPCRAGVRADVEIFNKNIQPQLLEDMKNGKKQDVSIGFFYSKDETSGVVESDSCKGQEYDYVQRNLFHDHLAAGIDQGRCPMPYCGLGADEIIKQFTGDPFSGFNSFPDCVEKMMKPKSEGGEGYSKEVAEKVCGKLKSEHEDNLLEEAVLGKSKEHMLLLLEEAYEELRGTVLSKKEKADGDWWRRIDWVTAVDESGALIYDQLPEETQTLIREAGLCPSCQDKVSEEQCPEGMTWNTEKHVCEPMDESDVEESNPGFSPGEAEHECPEGMEWNAEEERCVEIEDFDEDPVERLSLEDVLKRFDEVMNNLK